MDSNSIYNKNGIQRLFSLYCSGAESASPKVCCLANTTVTPCFKWCEERTCEFLLDPPESCDVACVPNICVCVDGLYRNECGACVTADQCKTPCKKFKPFVCSDPNEVIVGCFDPTKAKNCPSDGRSAPTEILSKFVVPKQSGLCALSVCDCKDGYLRNRCGQCVPENQCHEKCCISESTDKSNDCQNGLVRDKCGVCRAAEVANEIAECLCTNPCLQQKTVIGNEWQCLNDCNTRYCFNYYELEVFKNKTCPDECVYACQCSQRNNLWYNGTQCVTADKCPSYVESLKLKEYQTKHIISISDLAQLTDNYVEWSIDSYEQLIARKHTNRKRSYY